MNNKDIEKVRIILRIALTVWAISILFFGVNPTIFVWIVGCIFAAKTISGIVEL